MGRALQKCLTCSSWPPLCTTSCSILQDGLRNQKPRGGQGGTVRLLEPRKNQWLEADAGRTDDGGSKNWSAVTHSSILVASTSAQEDIKET